jgi:hypothetical protein
LGGDPSFGNFRVLRSTSSMKPSFHCRGDGPLGILGRENEDFPESIEMTSRDMASPYSRSLPGTPGNGYGKQL